MTGSVDAGSREENAFKTKTRAPFRFHRNGKGSRKPYEQRFQSDLARPFALESPARHPRRWPWLLLFVILALACATGVYAWPEIATLVPPLGHEASGGGMTAGDQETLPDLLASQQKGEEDFAALGRAVADQQEQLKTMVDQLEP